MAPALSTRSLSHAYMTGCGGMVLTLHSHSHTPAGRGVEGWCSHTLAHSLTHYHGCKAGRGGLALTHSHTLTHSFTPAGRGAEGWRSLSPLSLSNTCITGRGGLAATLSLQHCLSQLHAESLRVGFENRQAKPHRPTTKGPSWGIPNPFLEPSPRVEGNNRQLTNWEWTLETSPRKAWRESLPGFNPVPKVERVLTVCSSTQGSYERVGVCDRAR